MRQALMCGNKDAHPLQKEHHHPLRQKAKQNDSLLLLLFHLLTKFCDFVLKDDPLIGKQVLQFFDPGHSHFLVVHVLFQVLQLLD